MDTNFIQPHLLAGFWAEKADGTYGQRPTSWNATATWGKALARNEWWISTSD